MRHLSGRRFRRLDNEYAYLGDMTGRADCRCEGCGLCEPCQLGRHRVSTHRWSRCSLLAYGGLVAVIVVFIVAADHTAPMTDNTKHTHIVKDIMHDTDIAWEADHPDPLRPDQLTKGSAVSFSYAETYQRSFVSAWSPADLCDEITPNYWTVRGHGGWTTMQWCPDVAFALIQWPGWSVEHLMSLVSIMGCESSGDPYWNEQNWGTFSMSVFGLFSHRRVFWEDRTMTYLYRVGNKYEIGQKDDIALGVALYMAEGPWHWGGEGGCWGPVRRAISP